MNYTKKNRLLAGLTVLGVLVCWQFAFRKTFEAIGLHQELKSRVKTVNDLSFNRDYMERKLIALENILKTYSVEQETWSNDLWLKGSAASAKLNVALDYTREKSSTELTDNMVGSMQSLYCYGNFSGLVEVMNSLEGTPGVGRIATIQIKGPKATRSTKETEQCTLKMDFIALDLNDF